MRLLLIGCEILLREVCDAVIRSSHLIDVQFLPKGLHDQGGLEVRKRVQQAIDAADAARYDAIVLGYALCGNGLAGIVARDIAVVVPRAHDCITLLLGSRAAFKRYFTANPGTYYRSVGWVERGEAIQQQPGGLAFHRASLDSLIEQYGESNGRYLFEEYRRYEESYSRLAYIESGLEPDASFIERSRAEARDKNWTFETVPGDLTLFRRLLSADWNEDFLIVPPGHRTELSYDDDIVTAVPNGDPTGKPR
jgi:hypothetical protein